MPAHTAGSPRYSSSERGRQPRVTWADIQGGAIRVEQQKTGERLLITLHPSLADALAVTKRRAVTILATEKGQPYSVSGFNTIWRKEIIACDLQGVTFHGLRRNAAAALAEAGCSDREVMAVTGHRTAAMVSLYTKDAQQRRLADAAMRKRIKNERVASKPDESG